MDADIKLKKAQATALAAAAGSGVQGQNIADLLNDFEASEGMYNGRVDERLERYPTNRNEPIRYQTEAINRINSQQPVGCKRHCLCRTIADFSLDYLDTTARYAALDSDLVRE